MTEGELLKAIIPAIGGVHGYCNVCADELMERINEILDDTDCEFRYDRERSEDCDGYRVIIKREAKKVAVCEF